MRRSAIPSSRHRERAVRNRDVKGDLVQSLRRGNNQLDYFLLIRNRFDRASLARQITNPSSRVIAIASLHKASHILRRGMLKLDKLIRTRL